jgi:hypothetical protein
MNTSLTFGLLVQSRTLPSRFVSRQAARAEKLVCTPACPEGCWTRRHMEGRGSLVLVSQGRPARLM